MAYPQVGEMGRALVTYLCSGLGCLLLNVAALGPFSYAYSTGLFFKWMWWICWILSIGTATVLLFTFCIGSINEFNGQGCASSRDLRPECCNRIIPCTMCQVGLWPPVLLAGWWFLADYSINLHAEIRRDVEPQDLLEFYNRDDPPDAYLMKSGFVSEKPVNGSQSLRYMESFTFGCHGVYIEATCQGSYTTTCCCDENGNYCSYDTHYYDYDCSYWDYPHTCHGYNLISAAPVYEANVDTTDGTSGKEPIAVVYQLQTYLFSEQPGPMAVHYSSKLPEPFPAQLCADSKLCLLDLRSSFIDVYWSEYGNWAYHVVQDCGKHNYDDNKLNARNGLKSATKFITMWGQTHGIPLQGPPLLWMPSGVRQTFEKFEQSMKETEDDGETAKILIGLAAGVPGVYMIICIIVAFYTSDWIPGDNCCDYILCLKRRTAKVEDFKEPEAVDSEPEAESTATNKPAKSTATNKAAESELRSTATTNANEATNQPTNEPTNEPNV